MKIASGVEMLEISSDVMGMPCVINPTLIWDKDTVILVDAGFPGQLTKIRDSIEHAGVPFNKLSMLILTHHDVDHIGSVSSILRELPNVKVLAHKEEKAYIEGKKCPLKVAKMKDNLDSLPEKMKMVYEKLKAGFEKCKVNVDKTLIDGEKLLCCEGIEIIYTPGHTLGHICLYLKKSKILIAGDILKVENGILAQVSPDINFDMNLNIKSLKKLTEYDIQTVICYHGGLYNEKVNERIAELINE
ncbi:MBL fold metallo-hydrolase [Clostridium pasteurianum]|uniref:Zn-dependent hydrolase, glyoxylase n=1 Tax=Clostridium pasteurianum BC1 TaxID=86416 RepID=R4KDY4_CLOPA|nr:MBL fold metallo-hydrolase [Clostridium pasteurianum]AGK97830.1 Zn-dependent hydrolase, glyoxylase [Clostridium pasteurianum BC1]